MHTKLSTGATASTGVTIWLHATAKCSSLEISGVPALEPGDSYPVPATSADLQAVCPTATDLSAPLDLAVKYSVEPLHRTSALEARVRTLNLDLTIRVPAVTLHIRPLSLPPATADSPFSRALCEGRGIRALASTSPVAGCQCGTVTLDAARRVVLMPPGDPSCSTVPVVGIWFRLSPSSQGRDRGQAEVQGDRGVMPAWAHEATQHPSYRAAAVWYDTCRELGDRVRPAGSPDTLFVCLLPPQSCAATSAGAGSIVGGAVEPVLVETAVVWANPRSAGASDGLPPVPYPLPHGVTGGPTLCGDGCVSLTARMEVDLAGRDYGWSVVRGRAARGHGHGRVETLEDGSLAWSMAGQRVVPQRQVRPVHTASATVAPAGGGASLIPLPRYSPPSSSPRRHPRDLALLAWTSLRREAERAQEKAIEVSRQNTQDAYPGAHGANPDSSPQQREEEGEPEPSSHVQIAAIAAQMDALTARLCGVGAVASRSPPTAPAPLPHTFVGLLRSRGVPPSPPPRAHEALDGGEGRAVATALAIAQAAGSLQSRLDRMMGTLADSRAHAHAHVRPTRALPPAPPPTPPSALAPYPSPSEARLQGGVRYASQAGRAGAGMSTPYSFTQALTASVRPRQAGVGGDTPSPYSALASRTHTYEHADTPPPPQSAGLAAEARALLSLPRQPGYTAHMARAEAVQAMLRAGALLHSAARPA